MKFDEVWEYWDECWSYHDVYEENWTTKLIQVGLIEPGEEKAFLQAAYPDDADMYDEY
jgi:hypothetical protein